MPFSESTKEKAKRLAHYRCCFCESIAILEVHHIKPEADGGPNTLDNAVALCSGCHTAYGGNPVHRKFIKQRRNWWYGQCKKSHQKQDYVTPEELQRMLCVLQNQPSLKIQSEDVVNDTL
jgi:5-methylcytosine-specific restriction endonuclease McrA